MQVLLTLTTSSFLAYFGGEASAEGLIVHMQSLSLWRRMWVRVVKFYCWQGRTERYEKMFHLWNDVARWHLPDAERRQLKQGKDSVFIFLAAQFFDQWCRLILDFVWSMRQQWQNSYQCSSWEIERNRSVGKGRHSIVRGPHDSSLPDW